MSLSIKCEITLRSEEGTHEATDRFELTALDAALIIGRKYGFGDIDLEPVDKGWKLTAGLGTSTLVTRGKTQAQAVESFLRKVWE